MENKPDDLMAKKPKIDLKPKLHPMLRDLPDHLKDPANYEKIRKAILQTILTTCSHREMYEWSQCKKCTDKMLERRLLLRKLGFKNPAQYMAWQKIHEKIKERFPLVDWTKKSIIS